MKDDPSPIGHGDCEAIPVEAPQKIHAHLKNSQLGLLENTRLFPYIETPGEFLKP